MNEKCGECFGFVGSSCICNLADMIGDVLSSLSVKEYWISDVKYDYLDADCTYFVVDNAVVCEDIQFKE